MNKNLVSIVIPVYNSEKYLDRCIESLLNQTYKEFCIIFINDGSTDSSLSILEKYKQKYDFIKVYTQKNSGPAITRNKGIDMVKTKYLMFVDSDDYVDCDYVETFIKSIENTEYDMVIGGFKKTNGKDISFERKLSSGIFSKYIVVGPISKIIKTSFIKKHKIYFLDTNSSEDVYFTLNIIAKTNNIKTIPYVGYYYYDNYQSISNTAHKGFNQNIKILELLDKINFKMGIDNYNVELNHYYIIRYCIWYLLYSGRNASQKNFMFEYHKLFNWLSINIPAYKNNKYIRINGPKGEINNIGNIIFIFMLLHKLKLVKIFAKIYCKIKERK